jgi:hypothetical protein
MAGTSPAMTVWSLYHATRGRRADSPGGSRRVGVIQITRAPDYTGTQEIRLVNLFFTILR